MSGQLDRKAESHGPVLKPDDARQSIMTGHMRYVLGISTALAVVMMLIILFVAPPF